MTWTVRSKILSFPVDVVFDLLCDFERLGRAIPMLKKIEYLSEKRRGVGVRTRWITGVKVVDFSADYRLKDVIDAAKREKVRNLDLTK